MKIVLKTGFVHSAEKFSKRASTNRQNFAQKIAAMRHGVEQSYKKMFPKLTISSAHLQSSVLPPNAA